MPKRKRRIVRKRPSKASTEVAEAAVADGSSRPAISTRQRDLFDAAGITKGQVDKAALDWRDLAAVFEEHTRLREELEDTANFVATKLRRVSSVHSVRSRIKHPGHLIGKIVRKRLEDPERTIDFTNYKEEITDRIGIRALHLFKEDWRPIHEFVVAEWDLVEPPVAYHRDGDHPDWLSAFGTAGCAVKEHPRKYRSVHYLLKTAGSRAPTVVELQVRTLFEEAWSEIDHRINYPASAPYPRVGFFLEIFNRLAGSADEMGSFIHGLLAELSELSSRAERAETEREAALAEADGLIEKLKISTTERKQLRAQLSAVEDSTTGTPGSPWSITANEILAPNWTDVRASAIPFHYFQPSTSGIGSLLGSQRTCRHCGHTWTTDPGVIRLSEHCPACARPI